MNRETKILMVEPGAPRGPGFTELADAVEMETGAGMIAEEILHVFPAAAPAASTNGRVSP